MSKFKMVIGKIRVCHYDIMYKVASWRCDRLHKKRMRAIIRLDDRKYRLERAKAELVGEGA